MGDNSVGYFFPLYIEPKGRETAPDSMKAAVAIYEYSVTFPGASELSTRLAPSVRIAMRNAQRSGLEAQIMNSREAMQDYFRDVSMARPSYVPADDVLGGYRASFSAPSLAVNKWLGCLEYPRLG
jgi:hypothetical protein